MVYHSEQKSVLMEKNSLWWTGVDMTTLWTYLWRMTAVIVNATFWTTRRCIDSMSEIWKDIKGFEGIYQISNCGRIKSLARKVDRFSTRWEKDASYYVAERIRTGSPSRGGYLFIPLNKDGQVYPKRVNRLVAEAFLEGYSEDKEVHHIDGDKTNNNVENLMCLPIKEHRNKHTNKIKIVGEKDGVVLTFNSIEDVAFIGFTPSDVSRCCKCATLPTTDPKRKKYATHKGYKWRYAQERE